MRYLKLGRSDGAVELWPMRGPEVTRFVTKQETHAPVGVFVKDFMEQRARRHSFCTPARPACAHFGRMWSVGMDLGCKACASGLTPIASPTRLLRRPRSGASLLLEMRSNKSYSSSGVISRLGWGLWRGHSSMC